jgi:O-methyltransferase
MQEPLWRTRLDRREFVPNYHDRPRPEALDRISWTPRCVVDIGCGGGGAARELLSRFPGCRVYGLEHNAEAAAMARRSLHAVVCGDVESLDLAACGIPFSEADTVLLLDVLEHLANPWGLLARLRPLLPPGCRLVASIPNVANIALLDALAAGGFAYAENGLLDITHLRFFAAPQMRELFAATGFTVLDMADVAQRSGLPQPLFRGPDHVETARVTVKSRDQALLDDLFVLQKLVVAAPGPDPDFTPAPPPAASAPLAPAASPTQALRAAYLDMVMHSVLGLIHEDGSQAPKAGGTLPFDRARRESGLDWPVSAQSMIGLTRMRNVRDLAEQVLAQGVPGDFVETGVWRGGACIMFRAVLAAYGDATRRVVAADSFAGLPKPSPDRYPEDAGDAHHAYAELAVSLAQVQENFRRYGLLDDQVVFLEGWFKDTLPAAPVERIAVLRLDGDMYESTINALESLFPKVSPGGFVIVDDYGYARSCRAAVDDYRRAHGIDDPITTIDQFGVFWRKGGHVPRPAAAPAAPATPPGAAAQAGHTVPGASGYCPCCRRQVVFEVRGPWLRDQYRCPRCESIPRQRALLLALDRFVPGWERLVLHEVDACHESIRQRSSAYAHSVLRVGGSPSGPLAQDLEALTLADASVDLVVLQDVLALVCRPDAALREIVRVLRPGGTFVFTLARDLGLPTSRRRVRRGPDGVLEYLVAPVRYGAPDNDKYLLKWDFGLDFEALAGAWSGCPVSGVLVRDPQFGLDGEYLEVFILRKPDPSRELP